MRGERSGDSSNYSCIKLCRRKIFWHMARRYNVHDTTIRIQNISLFSLERYFDMATNINTTIYDNRRRIK